MQPMAAWWPGLRKRWVEVVKADTVNARGLRNAIDGEAELLEGFEFNIDGKLATTFYAPYTATIDRATGSLTISIPSFVPLNMIKVLGETTHFKLVSAGAAVDFEGGTYVTDAKESAIQPWDESTLAAVNLTHAVPANSPHPLFLVSGVEFYQEVNGTMYTLKNGTFNALSIVKVSGL
jgi:hypothetical protein